MIAAIAVYLVVKIGQLLLFQIEPVVMTQNDPRHVLTTIII
jgi:hypothetical protein